MLDEIAAVVEFTKHNYWCGHACLPGAFGRTGYLTGIFLLLIAAMFSASSWIGAAVKISPDGGTP
jgi:hypothetical protein